jgi:EAL domain-containing protein (putative c-di-GMP-specific phosphodiesterase class I)
MDVVAEGIESQRHLEFLRRHNCHFGQGKLFGEPCTSAELQALLARQASGTPPFGHLLTPIESLNSRSA